MLQFLSYELSILAKAVNHKNLSAAAVHVGLSQPQLSRLVGKIEHELNVVLLDRSARRKSGWTPIAQELSLTYSRGIGRLEAEIVSLAKDMEITELRIGTLEGIANIATEFVKECFKELKMRVVFLDVLEFADLDAQFLGNNLDLIFTVAPPGRQKFQNILEVGFQQMEKISTDRKTLVVGPLDYAAVDKKTMDGSQQALVSNSLAIRRHWLKDFGGNGIVPVDAQTGRGKGQYTIYLVGSNLLSPRLWENIKKLI